MSDSDPSLYTDLADGGLSGEVWEAWQAENPEAAAEIERARRVRALIGRLREAQYEVPEGFEERVLARVRADATILTLLDFGLAGVGRMLIDLLNALFGLAGPARTETAAAR